MNTIILVLLVFTVRLYKIQYSCTESRANCDSFSDNTKVSSAYNSANTFNYTICSSANDG